MQSFLSGGAHSLGNTGRSWNSAIQAGDRGGSANGYDIFFDDFATNDLSKTENGFLWSPPTNTTVENNALHFNYNVLGNPSSEQRFSLGGYYSEVWCRYRLYVPANYFHIENAPSPSNNKGFLTLWDDDYENPKVSMSVNFWANTGNNGDSEGTMFVWLPTIPFDYHYYAEWPDNKCIRQSDVGKWMTVLLHYKYATSANNDGVAQVWAKTDGEATRTLMDKTNGPWYVASAPGFNSGYIFGSTNSDFSGETILVVDDIYFSTTELTI